MRRWLRRRYRGFIDDDRSIYWPGVRAHLKSRLWVAHYRAHNRLQDARARILGACNADTWAGDDVGYAGGYSHWRCGRERGHAGKHRFHNYTWTGSPNDSTEYDPIPIPTRDQLNRYRMDDYAPFWRIADGRKPVTSRRRGRKQVELLRRSRLRPRRIEKPVPPVAATERLG